MDQYDDFTPLDARLYAAEFTEHLIAGTGPFSQLGEAALEELCRTTAEALLSSPPPRPRCSAARSRTTGLVFGLIGMLFAVSGCAAQGEERAAPPPTEISLVGDELVAKLVVDPTGSSVSEFAVDVIEATAWAIETRYTEPTTTDDSVAQPAVPAITVYVRVVSSYCYSTAAPSLILTLPEVPALAARPALDSADLTEELVDWQNASSVRSEAFASAATVAAEAAAELRALELDRKTRSAVAACVAASSETGPQDASTRMFVASDLFNNEPKMKTDLNGGSVVLLQSCPAKRTLECPEQSVRWQEQLLQQNAGSVDLFRADELDAAIAAWLGETA